MSKRYIFPQQYGDRKKPKLDVTISDHNFPLSQNPAVNKESSASDNWGDENDDEILLLASQACEEVYNQDISTLPDYSFCMQPGTTSTQLSNDPGPSTSKKSFSFKKPVSTAANMMSTSMSNRYQRISSPLPGITPKVMQKTSKPVNITDDLIFNDKILKGQDTESVYRQMLLLQEENAKLKSENGKLIEKCVTKDGEASILRTQLKASQVSVNNARLDKIRAQERVQLEFNEKLTAVNKHMQDLKTQLDFKNLEIISTKEKCKMLESSKVKLTQVTVPANDISMSHRANHSFTQEQYTTHNRRVKVMSNAVQTDNKELFIKLNKVFRIAKSSLNEIIRAMQQPTPETNSILDYSEKLQKRTDFSQNKIRVFSTFHRIPSTPIVKPKSQCKLMIDCLFEDVAFVAAKSSEDGLKERFERIVSNVNRSLEEVCAQLDKIAQRMTPAFQREMDERYIEATSEYLHIDVQDLIYGRCLYKDEHAILPRRMTAILAEIVQSIKSVTLVNRLLEVNCNAQNDVTSGNLLDLISRICSLCDSTSCTILFSGLVLSITILLETLWEQADKSTLHTKLLDLTKIIITSRPLPVVSFRIVNVLRKLATHKNVVDSLCPGNTGGNLKHDYDQGVLLYKKDSCYLQILLKEVETALKCIEKQKSPTNAASATEALMGLYSNTSEELSERENMRCECHVIFTELLVYLMQICAVLLDTNIQSDALARSRLQWVVRSGLPLLQWCGSSGPQQTALHAVQRHKDQLTLSDTAANMLSEMYSTIQPAEEQDLPSEQHKHVWINSFKRFHIEE